MRYNLFLDDVRQPEAVAEYIYPEDLRPLYVSIPWIIVRNYKDFVEYITEYGLPDLVSFDHDLAAIHYNPKTWTEGFKYDEETGYDCAKWLVQYCIENDRPLPLYLCHSMNPFGKQNILSYLDNYKKHYE